MQQPPQSHHSGKRYFIGRLSAALVLFLGPGAAGEPSDDTQIVDAEEHSGVDDNRVRCADAGGDIELESFYNGGPDGEEGEGGALDVEASAVRVAHSAHDVDAAAESCVGVCVEDDECRGEAVGLDGCFEGVCECGAEGVEGGDVEDGEDGCADGEGAPLEEGGCCAGGA